MTIKRLPKHSIAIALFVVTLMMLILWVAPGKTTVITRAEFSKINSTIAEDIDFSPEINQFSPILGCEVQPPLAPPNPSLPESLTSIPITSERFRRSLPPSEQKSTSSEKTNPAYSPKEIIALEAASNYGDRYLKDLDGNPTNYPPIIVLHETVAPINSVINFFQAFQTDEENQASYHTLIAIDGTVVYLVPPDKRAFGAGDSVFISASGKETVQTNPRYPSSVNNFAYHISLETPEDGMHNGSTHSGYSESQYQSLAWLVAKTTVPLERITTHKAVDLSGSRIDPRSFNQDTFEKYLSKYSRTNEIIIGCS